MRGHGIGGHRHGQELGRAGEEKDRDERQSGVIRPEALSDPIEGNDGDRGENRGPGVEELVESVLHQVDESATGAHTA